MAAENVAMRSLFGGAVSTTFPARFQDLSLIRQIPDHQEAFADPLRDESLIIELLELKTDVEDANSAVWFLRDLASEQDAEESFVLENASGVEEAIGLTCNNVPSVFTTAVCCMAVSKGKQGREAQNLLRVYLANLRLKGVGTDVLITAYEPILINHLSESAQTVGAGLTVPADQSGLLPVADVFRMALSSFKIHDWSLFGSGA